MSANQAAPRSTATIDKELFVIDDNVRRAFAAGLKEQEFEHRYRRRVRQKSQALLTRKRNLEVPQPSPPRGFPLSAEMIEETDDDDLDQYKPSEQQIDSRHIVTHPSAWPLSQYMFLARERESLVIQKPESAVWNAEPHDAHRTGVQGRQRRRHVFCDSDEDDEDGGDRRKMEPKSKHSKPLSLDEPDFMQQSIHRGSAKRKTYGKHNR